MKKRSIGLIILFSIITFGIYDIYWFIKQTNDSNQINPSEKTASGGLAFLFMLITGSIYYFYWIYKLGKKVDNGGALYLILAFFGFGWLMQLIGQSKINAYIDAHPEVAAQ